MKRRGKLLFWAGVICVMGGLLFVGLFEFTPLRQGLQDRLVLDSLEEFEYRILSVQKDENGKDIIDASFDGREQTQEELDEVMRKAERRGEKKLVQALWLGSWIGISGLVLMTTGYILQILPKRRTEEKTSRSRRRRALRAIPRNTPQAAPARPALLDTMPPTRSYEDTAPTWEGFVSLIRDKLLHIEDRTTRELLREGLDQLLLKEQWRRRIPKVEHFLEGIEEVIAGREEPPSHKEDVGETADSDSSQQGILNLPDLLLPIDHLVSGSGIDPGIIKAILIVFLRPASQKPLFGKKGASQEAIRRRAGIPSQDTDKGLRWLSRIGLLRQGTHARVERGGFSLILNPTGSPAKEIAQLMLRVRWTIEQKGVLIR